MPPNYSQLDRLITSAVGEIPAFRDELSKKREIAIEALFAAQDYQEKLAETTRHLTARIDRMLRCVSPTREPIATQYAPGDLTQVTTLVGADGSQIQPDPKAGLWWGLTNSAAITMQIWPELIEPPTIRVETELFLENKRVTPRGIVVTKENVDLYRDLRERELLAEAVTTAGDKGFRLGLLDSQIELWGSRDPKLVGEYLDSLKKCIDAFEQIRKQGAAYAGYVDGVDSDLLVRLLEIALTPDEQLHQVRKLRPLLGLTDSDILKAFLQPGHRSAVFELRTRARGAFSGDLAIFLFYMNVGVPDEPHIVRVEIPAFVADRAEWIGQIHAAILQQCKILPNIRYPYILERAHEEARVTRQDSAAIQSRITQAFIESGIRPKPNSPKFDGKGLIR